MLSFYLSLVRRYISSAQYVPLYASGLYASGFFSCVGRMADTCVRFWVCPLGSACMNTNMTPTLTFRFLGMGFLRATLLECTARCIQTCLATLTVSVFLFCHLNRAFS